MKKEERFTFWKKVRDTIDKSIGKKHGVDKKCHIARYTGLFQPTQYVLFEDNSEVGYTMEQERVLKQALDFRLNETGTVAEIEKELKGVV